MALPGGSIAFENEGKESCSIESFKNNHNVRQLMRSNVWWDGTLYCKYKNRQFSRFPIVVVPWLDFQ